MTPRFLRSPRRGPWLLVPIGLMVAWQILSSIPALAYYRDHDIAAGRSVTGQLSSHLNALGSTAQNVAHVPAFFLIAWAWCWALSARHGPKRAAFPAFAIAGLFGVVNELSQLFVPYRWASPLDALANLVGVLLAVILHRALTARRRRMT